MRVLSLSTALLLAFALNQGCSCSHNGAKGRRRRHESTMSALAGGDIVITPADVTLDITPGGAAADAGLHREAAWPARTSPRMATWTVDDTTLGSFCRQHLHRQRRPRRHDAGARDLQRPDRLRHAARQAARHGPVGQLPGCPPFPPDTTPACTAMAQTPTVLYPPDGTLVPPNMNVLETAVRSGRGQHATSRSTTRTPPPTCASRRSAIADHRLQEATPPTAASTICRQQVWDFIAQSNRGGDPLNIIVRATDANGTCIATSQTQVAISFARGGSQRRHLLLAVGRGRRGLQGATGGIFRYDFGKRGQTPQAFLAPTVGAGKTRAASAATSCRATASEDDLRQRRPRRRRRVQRSQRQRSSTSPPRRPTAI